VQVTIINAQLAAALNFVRAFRASYFVMSPRKQETKVRMITTSNASELALRFSEGTWPVCHSLVCAKYKLIFARIFLF
jgi:hypothetical protein